MANPDDTSGGRVPFVRRLMHLYWRLQRGLTLGVRGIVIDDEDRVFLVRHTYVAGWHLPGGGVEPGETAVNALRRELVEEASITFLGEPRLHGLFFNERVSNRDHVLVYVVWNFERSVQRVASREIAEAGFFPLRALPDGTTPATRARLAELLHGQKMPLVW